ncbi:MAG TPA: ADP-ribosylglycohydrolase family protein [Anaerolineae bacterium]|nr:ADP-ribosylglycohydrolase family protein [Anaerolineae bacterium]
MLLPERLEGAVYGHLCGDALGVPYEFQPPDHIGAVEWRGHGSHDRPPGTWSDDGALMLALLDSLLTVGFDTADQALRALAWRDEGAYAPGGLVFDIGTATSQALHQLRSGTPPEEAGGVDAKGNGSLMRILPLALVCRGVDDEGLVDMAVRASRVTHGSAEAQIACALYVLIVGRLLRGDADRADVLADSVACLRDHLGRNGLPGSKEAAPASEALTALDDFVAWPGRRGSGRVVDSFWSAWDAFAAAADYAGVVVRAVEYGHDTDTTAAIAGGLAGAYFGVHDIPSGWRFGLRDRRIPQELADRLVETDVSDWDGKPWQTSHRRPLRVDFLDLDGTDLATDGGRVGMTFLPGKRYLGYYTGPHWRDLVADAIRLRELGVDILLLLVEDDELERCRVTDVVDVLPAQGVELVRHPIADPRLPADDRAYRLLLAGLAERVRKGATLAIACRGGLDRAGMTSACLLRECGLEADTAIDRVHAARHHTLTMLEQLRYVRAWPPT